MVLHVMIFLLMFLVVWVVRVTGQEVQLPVPLASLGDVERAAISTATHSPVLEPEPDGGGLSETPPGGGGGVGDGNGVDLLSAVALADTGGISIIGIGAGGGGDDSGALGVGIGSFGEGPSFFGLGRGDVEARKICYVVDRSGSMVSELDYVKDEVIRSINRLHRAQQFHIMFFNRGAPIEVPPGRFVHAIKEYKQQAFEFISGIVADGQTDPVPAMARAFRHEPDLIYFLTDGEFTPDLIDQLRVWNREEKVRIYTIAFLNNVGESLLRQIARENGGEYRFVSLNELR